MDSPGPSRAAMTSSLLARGILDNAIMMAADWASAHTMYANYARLILGEALNHSAVSLQFALGVP